ncbi:relaxase/mobilization nuclease domain-containing protein [Sphingomonas sp. I4]
MIVKHIPARPAGRNATIERARHARNLVDYLRQPEKQSAEKDYQVAYMLREGLGDTKGERLFHVGARNFVSTDIAGQRAEMIAIAQMASRSPNPIDHWLLSWREGELPTPAEIDETVAMFLEHLGVDNQPCIYACHGDTDNRHVHLALNRYDPLSERMVEINDGFTREAAHQATALIVDRFGWQAEADARYSVVNGRLVTAASAAAKRKEGRKPLSPKATAFENRTGYRSGQRIVQEDAVPRIKAARSWSDLHATLAEVGIRYDIVGTNGVTLTVDGERVKASSIDRAITRTQVEKRLGPFEPRGETIRDVSRNPHIDRLAEAFRADEYRAECERWRQQQQIRREQRSLLAGPTREEGEQAQPAVGQVQPPFTRPPPNLESWYYARREGAFAKRWRHRFDVEEVPHFSGVAQSKSGLPTEIDGYYGYPCSDGTRYARGPDEPTAFLDRGPKIAIVLQDEEAMLAALRLAALKFDGKVSVNGDKQFRERTFEIAQRHGLGHVLADADLAAKWRELQPEAGSQGPKPSTVVQNLDAQTGENGSREIDGLGQSAISASLQSNTSSNSSPADVSVNPAALEVAGRPIDPASAPQSESVSDLSRARALALAGEQQALRQPWNRAFAKLGEMGRLPFCDEAGRWSISTEGLTLAECRALSAPSQDSETQKRFAEMNAHRPESEPPTTEFSQVTKQSVIEIGRLVATGKDVDPTRSQKDVLASARLSKAKVSSGKELPERGTGGKER